MLQNLNIFMTNTVCLKKFSIMLEYQQSSISDKKIQIYLAFDSETSQLLSLDGSEWSLSFQLLSKVAVSILALNPNINSVLISTVAIKTSS